jgi:arabinoxylan arabinofuranohydrolase
MTNLTLLTVVGIVLTASTLATMAANPLVKNVFTADPAARAFGDRIYVYTTHDENDATYWNTVDWHLLSTTDLATWKDHGAVFTLKGFSWATRWAWAPDCVSANGKYYLFLPVDRTQIGVAVSDSPEGPFADAIGGPLIDNAVQTLAGVEPIDPAVLIDDDGQSYLYFGCCDPKVVKLDPSMTKLAGDIQNLPLIDDRGQKMAPLPQGKNPTHPQEYAEAPFAFKREGKYYFVYSNGWTGASTLVYAMGQSPLGPFTFVGKLMEHATANTQHGSVVQFHGKWYVFYHTNELSGGNNFRRSVCVDELTFDTNGKINVVKPTREGPAPVK